MNKIDLNFNSEKVYKIIVKEHKYKITLLHKQLGENFYPVSIVKIFS